MLMVINHIWLLNTHVKKTIIFYYIFLSGLILITYRTVAMIVILIKAGLGLDAGALKKLSFVVLRLAFAPCVTEAVTVAVVAHFLLGFSWLWGFLLGYV